MDSVETQRLLLRPFTLEDLPSLHTVIGEDPDMAWNQKPRTIEETEKVLQGRLKHYSEHDFGIWAVILKDTDEMIGQAGLQQKENTTEIELVAYTAKRFWHQGIAFEACIGSLTYGFRKLALEHIVACTRLHNVSAQKLTLKLGFHFVGEDKAYGYDVYYYKLTHQAFNPGEAVYIMHSTESEPGRF